MVVPIISALIVLAFTHLMQMDKYSKDFAKANIEFKGNKYLKAERFGIGSSLCVIAFAALAWGEIVGYKKEIEAFPIVVFGGLGGVGTWALSYFLGGTRKLLWKTIDKKTNIADGIED